MDFFSAIILGIIEGLTEFLPVSSTGHMILGAKLLGISQDSSAVKCFEVVIQLGSILAVLAMFFKKLRHDFLLWLKLIVGFIPTGLIGFLAYKYIKELFSPGVVAYALIIGGIVLIAIELWRAKREFNEEASNLDDVGFKQAFMIGLSQCFAMIPGTSRSAATIIAGLLCGLNRKTAAAFSFLLALPTMFAATFYDAYKNREIFVQNADNILVFLLGGVVAFIVAFAVVKVFLQFLARFSFIGFGVYRILVGLAFLFFIIN